MAPFWEVWNIEGLTTWKHRCGPKGSSSWHLPTLFRFYEPKGHPGAKDDDVEGGVDVEKEEPGLPLKEKVKVGHGVVPILGTFKKIIEFWEQILLESL